MDCFMKCNDTIHVFRSFLEHVFLVCFVWCVSFYHSIDWHGWSMKNIYSLYMSSIHNSIFDLAIFLQQ